MHWQKSGLNDKKQDFSSLYLTVSDAMGLVKKMNVNLNLKCCETNGMMIKPFNDIKTYELQFVGQRGTIDNTYIKLNQIQTLTFIVKIKFNCLQLWDGTFIDLARRNAAPLNLLPILS